MTTGMHTGAVNAYLRYGKRTQVEPQVYSRHETAETLSFVPKIELFSDPHHFP